MSIFKNYYLFVFALIIAINITSCDSDDPIPDDENPISEEILKVNDFIKVNMDFYYLWADEMPALDPTEQEDSEEYFYNLLYDDIDKWSFVTDDAAALTEYFSGVRKEMGYSLAFYYAYENNTNDLVAFIEYVEPDSPADIAGLKRGDMIVKYDGADLTINNYTDFYYAETATVGLGEYVDGVIADLSPSVNVTAAEIQVDPILVNTVFEYNGNKVGYLAYTSFISDYNDDLEAVFADFKNEGITDLILDLRYNGGGSVATAKLMAGMIGPSTLYGDLFIRSSYNETFTAAILKQYSADSDWFIDNFETYDNNLNLSRLYVLTTSGTASASEMVMYSLMPYMEVIQIGKQTHGKYYASVTLEDEQGLNWAIQPIILRAENKTNSIDYSQGLIPDYELYDNYTYQLGDKNEVLTATALDLIWGTSLAQQSLKKSAVLPNLEKSSVSIKKNPLQYQMLIDREL